MYILAKFVHCFFPLIALLLLIIGTKKNAIYQIIAALWLSIIALIIHFESSGAQILGNYFNYSNAAIYTLNLIVLFFSLIRVISHLSIQGEAFQYVAVFFKGLLFTGCTLVIINLWTNAYFIENRMKGTPIMQVALVAKSNYCSYRYVFYKVATNGEVFYLCPNHYGLIPSIGRLNVNQDNVATQNQDATKSILSLQQNKKQ